MKALSLYGKRQLNGEVRISGAKNAALPILASCLLSKDPIHLSNVPELNDVKTMIELLKQLGAQVQGDHRAHLEIQAKDIHSIHAPYELVRTMRASVLVLGSLLGRFKEACVALPGGCAIGARPVDQHLKAFEALGAEIEIKNGNIYARAKQLIGADITMDMITVTGTENAMMAAVLAEGNTIIRNAACEPEVSDLANFLNTLGAKIEGIGTHTLRIQGVPELHGGRYHIMPDRIESGTYLVAAMMTQGDIYLKETCPLAMESVLDCARRMGAELKIESGSIHIKMKNKPKAISITTAPYPDFPTDMQAQFLVLNCIAEGAGSICETIFENRFMHVLELQRMGADIRLDGNTAFTQGNSLLQGAPVMATDLRASACLVLAALAAEGNTIIDRIYHLDRGYEHIEEKLSNLGAKIERVQV